MRISERLQEILFGAGLLLAMILPLPAGELMFRIHDQWQARTGSGFNWAGMRAAVMYPAMRGEMGRFRPQTDYEGIHINALGFRGRDVPATPPPGTIRINFIGDSKLLGADLPHDAIIPEQTLRALQTRLPDCSFDYVLVAGPGWSSHDLITIAASEIRPLEAEVSLVLSVGHESLLQEFDRRYPDRPQLARHRSWLELRFRLADMILGIHHLELERRRAARIERTDILPDTLVREIYQDLYSELADALGSDEIIAVAYRTALRSGQTAEQKQTLSQPLRSAVHALDATDLVEIYDAMSEGLSALADRRGWAFIDPIHTLALDRSNFTDPGHLSAAGVAGFSEAAADTIAGRLRNRGHACAAD